MTSAQDATRVELLGEFDIEESHELKPVLIAALDGGCSRLEIDMSGVEFAGSICLQSLLEAHQHGSRLGIAVVIVAASPVARRLLQVTDLAAHFGLDTDAPPSGE